ncbi:MAG: quinohemoprotein amine dehydrogenase maturation protein [Bryobacterales bacterium]|nr:quinohemoprotein amine dehydrogenase maturation protein [Bryobacterales bacterium]
MSAAVDSAVYRPAEFHRFEAGGRQFVYLVPSAGVFELNEVSGRILDLLAAAPHSAEMLAERLPQYAPRDVFEALEELYQSHAIQTPEGFHEPPQQPPPQFPLQSLVLNLTNQCNLSCQYCYEFGEDKIATPDGKPKFMDWETATQAVDYFFRDSAGRRSLHITFFGGETLMNFPLLKRVVEYARNKAAGEGRSLDFSLTTNATLLTPQIIQFLSENQIGVTVSIDGPKEMNDALRVFSTGKGSYDIIAPKVKQLLAEHKTRPIAARVTLTAQVADVLKIFRHLTEELGFQEVGFAPVTTSSKALYSIGPSGLDRVLEQFRELALEYRDWALAGRHHAFSNVSDTIAEIHQGVSKSHPCGAGLGLVGVGPSGDISPCHRFVDSDPHTLGHVSHGMDRDKQADFLTRGHIHSKYDCHSCWARPVCAGGCHHEAFVRYGDTGHPNLHYCDWIRGWTDLCLQIYGEIAVRNPEFLAHFDRRKTLQ